MVPLEVSLTARLPPPPMSTPPSSRHKEPRPHTSRLHTAVLPQQPLLLPMLCLLLLLLRPSKLIQTLLLLCLSLTLRR